MRDSFIDTLREVSRHDKNIFLLTADLGFKLFDGFRQEFPDRFINVGIAEPNMIGVASGMALVGKKVYCYSMIPFLIMRCFEQIRLDVCYNKANVRLIGIGCGLTYGAEGFTHHAFEDLALMRTLANMTIVSPGDPYEARECIKESVDYPGPLYVRFGKTGDPSVHSFRPNFKIGKGIVISESGEDICIISAGTMLHKAKSAAAILSEKGYGVTLVSMHTIKPLDSELIKALARKYNSIFSVEDHSMTGGLGSAIGEVLLESKFKGIFKKIGLADEFNRYIGGGEYLYGSYGLMPNGIVKSILKTIKEGS
jgi:transketolase